MTVVKIHEAKTNLSKLLARVEAGEEIVIARGDKLIAKVVPLQRPPRKNRVAGAMKGIWPVVPDAFFFEPLPDEELAGWEGGSDETRPR